MIAWQATCVAIGERAILIEGPPGSGKSSLALALIDRGAILIGDDSVLLESVGVRLVARPHPKTSGLLEVRNLGLFEMPVAAQADVALIVMLDPSAERFITEAKSTVREGVAVPIVQLWPDSPVQHLKAEMALRRFGLPPACVQ